MTRGGVVGAELVGRARSDVGSAFDWGLVGGNSAGGGEAVSGFGQADDSLHIHSGAGRSGYARAKVKEYVSELQSVLEFEDWSDAYYSMFATLNALGDGHATSDTVAFLRKVAENLPAYIRPEEAVMGVFNVLLPRVRKGEVEDFTVTLPGGLLDIGLQRRLKYWRTEDGDMR